MHSKITRLVVGATVALSLFGAAGLAQASSLTSAQISSILNLLQVFGADQSVINNVAASLTGQATAPAPVSNPSTVCATFVGMKKGDTDATTGGRVTPLQVFLGISPTTGYYGPLTAIGYTNKCVGGNAQPTAVAGMSQYTDSTFGFSFWYPSSGNVTTVASNTSGETMYGAGTNIVKTLKAPEFTIDEVSAPAMSILSSVDAGCCGSSVDRYFFDSSAHTWMEYSDGGSSGKGPSGTFAANVSKNTMGGLHILQGYTRFGNKVIIPLSATHFLALYSACNDATGYECSWGTPGGGQDKFNKAVQTIVATDPTVATPVSTAQQLQTIQAEANAYGVSTSNVTQTYSNAQYGFTLQYPNGVNIDTNTVSTQSYDANMASGVQVAVIGPITKGFTAVEPDWGDNGFVSTMGKITLLVSSSAADVKDCMVAPASAEDGPYSIHTVSMGGTNYLSYGMGGPAAGLFGDDQLYKTLHNGVCYSIDAQITGGESSHMIATDAAANTAVIAQVNAELNSITQSFGFTK